jgi:hypothetical protein
LGTFSHHAVAMIVTFWRICGHFLSPPFLCFLVDNMLKILYFVNRRQEDV